MTTKLTASQFKDPNTFIKFIPLVNELEGIHKSYRMKIN